MPTRFLDDEFKEYTAEVIRIWAYDPSALLSSQDEDLVATSELEFFPTLISAASDVNCPKCQYILGILWDYTLFLFRYRHLDQLDHIYTCIQKQNQTNASKVDSEWSGFFDYYHTLINTPRPINKSDADRIARDLIGNTDDTAGLVSIEKKNGTINYQRRSWNLLVTLQTGQWKFSENERYVMNHLNNLGTEQG